MTRIYIHYSLHLSKEDSNISLIKVLENDPNSELEALYLFFLYYRLFSYLACREGRVEKSHRTTIKLNSNEEGAATKEPSPPVQV